MIGEVGLVVVDKDWTSSRSDVVAPNHWIHCRFIDWLDQNLSPI
jgi:hypothetical protein